MTDRHKGSPRQPGCRLRRRSRAELTDLGRDRRPGVLPVVPDDPVADRRVSVLTLSLQKARQPGILRDLPTGGASARGTAGSPAEDVERDPGDQQAGCHGDGQHAAPAAGDPPISAPPLTRTSCQLAGAAKHGRHERAGGAGALAAEKGLDFEYRMGEYIGIANQQA